MRVFFDTEFIENGETIDLISIGMIKENGDTYYAISTEFEIENASDWVMDNVITKLESNAPHKTNKQIAKDIVEFAGDSPEFWAYYADYDWVVLCQLYGTMMEIPDTWGMFCMDIKQMCVERGNPRLPVQSEGDEHNALSDAIWNVKAFNFLRSIKMDYI